MLQRLPSRRAARPINPSLATIATYAQNETTRTHFSLPQNPKCTMHRSSSTSYKFHRVAPNPIKLHHPLPPRRQSKVSTQNPPTFPPRTRERETSEAHVPLYLYAYTHLHPLETAESRGPLVRVCAYKKKKSARRRGVTQDSKASRARASEEAGFISPPTSPPASCTTSHFYDIWGRSARIIRLQRGDTRTRYTPRSIISEPGAAVAP